MRKLVELDPISKGFLEVDEKRLKRETLLAGIEFLMTVGKKRIE